MTARNTYSGLAPESTINPLRAVIDSMRSASAGAARFFLHLMIAATRSGGSIVCRVSELARRFAPSTVRERISSRTIQRYVKELRALGWIEVEARTIDGYRAANRLIPLLGRASTKPKTTEPPEMAEPSERPEAAEPPQAAKQPEAAETPKAAEPPEAAEQPEATEPPEAAEQRNAIVDAYHITHRNKYRRGGNATVFDRFAQLWAPARAVLSHYAARLAELGYKGDAFKQACFEAGTAYHQKSGQKTKDYPRGFLNHINHPLDRWLEDMGDIIETLIAKSREAHSRNDAIPAPIEALRKLLERLDGG